jgi:hypothetical protein
MVHIIKPNYARAQNLAGARHIHLLDGAWHLVIRPTALIQIGTVNLSPCPKKY